MVSDGGATASQRTELQVSDQRPLLRRIGGWFADHLRVCGEATTYLGEHLLSSFVVWLMIGTALAMPGLLWLGHANVSALSQDWEGPSLLITSPGASTTDEKRYATSRRILIPGP